MRVVARRWMSVLMVAAASVLAGCSAAPFGGSAQMCVSWVAFDSEAEMAAAAQAVLVVTDIEADGRQQYLGVEAAAYRATIVSVDAGPFEAGDTVRIVSSEDGCGPAYGGADDPMRGGEVLRVYLAKDDGFWHTLTPFDGVVVVE